MQPNVVYLRYFKLLDQITKFEISAITIRLKRYKKIWVCGKYLILFILIYLTILHTPVCQATICWSINSFDFLLFIYGSFYPSNYLTIYPSIHLPIYPFPSVYLSIHLYIYHSIHLFIFPSVHLSIYPPIHLSINPSIHLYTYTSIHLTIYPSIHLSIYPSIPLSTSLCSRHGRISHGSAVSMLNIHKSSNTQGSVGSKSSILTSSSILTNGSIQHNSLNSRLNNSNQNINSIKPVYWSNYKVLYI